VGGGKFVGSAERRLHFLKREEMTRSGTIVTETLDIITSWSMRWPSSREELR
jgi:hypothetical protein